MHTQVESNELFETPKQWKIFFSFLFVVFLINLSFEYKNFLSIKTFEVTKTQASVQNIYLKKDYFVLKLQTPQFTFYTSASNNSQNIQKLDDIELFINTNNINFFDYLKGFYATSFNIFKLPQTNSTFKSISDQINIQHEDEKIAEIFNALFLGIPISSELRAKCVDFGVSHLFAISGFHLGVLAFVLFIIGKVIYAPIHNRFFPYRNIKYDILLATSLVLFSYLLFLGMIPSLLRACVMFVFALILARNNIKLISFQTLLIILLTIIAVFPKLVFSLSLWLSIAGVFYIFLFIRYFSHLSKTVQFLFFNVWIFLAMTPIVHQFFNIGSIHQIYSPLFTIGFSVFYPLELFLHFIGFGNLLDPLILKWLSLDVYTYETYSSYYIFFTYIFISLMTIYKKEFFWLLNLSLIIFSSIIYF